jgi:alanine dehydrogenase
MANSETQSENISFKNIKLMPQEEMLELSTKRRQLVIGIPREMQKIENRIALTPQAVELLIANGHRIIVEKNAGKAANYTDEQYAEAGADIAETKQEVFKSEMILKVSALSAEEIGFLHERQTVISSINFSSQTALKIKQLQEKRVTTVAFEYLKDENDSSPIVRSMNEIAGTASIMVASEYLSNVNGGKGVLLGGITGITPTEVVVLGAGAASENAIRAALGFGASVKVFDSSINKLRELKKVIGQSFFTSVLQPTVLKKELKSADVVIGALQLHDTEQQFLISEQMIYDMKKGSVIIDLCINNATSIETSRLTDHNTPVFEKFGVIHYCVPNITSRFARSASIALSNVIVPLLIKIGEAGGLRQQLKNDIGIRQGVYIYKGILTNQYIGKTFGIPSKDINLLTAAF